jgi:small subunit ribosomal protein S5
MNYNTVSSHNSTYIEKIISIRRVAKVVKGGRRFSFSALVVVGNGIDKIGFGLGKAKEVPEAIRKGKEKALKRMITIKKMGNSIPHKVTGKFGAGLVIMLPGKDGTGIIAGGAMRSVFEALGIKDILAKSIRSKNSGSIIRATINGLMQLTLYSDKKKSLASKNKVE